MVNIFFLFLSTTSVDTVCSPSVSTVSTPISSLSTPVSCAKTFVSKLPDYEELIYAVRSGVIKAGKIKMVLKHDSTKNSYFIRCDEKTEGLMNFIFKIDDWFTSLSDSNFVTKKLEKHIREGKYKKDHIMVIEDGQATYEDGKVVTAIDSAKDILNIWYWLRTRELTPGDTIFVPLHADKKNYRIKTHIGTEIINGDSCISIIPELVGVKAFGSGEGLTMYYSKDKIPVRFTINFKWGNLEAQLQERNLKPREAK